MDDKKKLGKVYGETVEVIISDSRLISRGSQFGHAAIIVDGIAYSMSHNGYDNKKSYASYVDSQQRLRDSIDFILGVSAEEKNKIKQELEKRIVNNRHYHILANSCSTNVVEVLETIGIQAYDPRFIPGLITPTDILIGLERSSRLDHKKSYPKYVVRSKRK